MKWIIIWTTIKADAALIKGIPRRDQGPNRNKKNHQSILAFLICLLVTLVCFSLFTNMLQDNSSEITYDKFIDMVN